MKPVAVKSTNNRIHNEQGALPWRMFLLIAPLCWILYANSLGNAFVFDDVYTVVNNDVLRNFSFRSFLSEWYRPVRDLSLVIDYWFWGLNPSGFRLTNILIHSINSCLAYLLAWKIANDSKTALLAALLFAVHPIQTDAVAYISGRRDVLFTLFYFLSFYAFIRFRETHRWPMALGSVAAFALSLLTKEMAATLPAILLLWDFYARWKADTNQSFIKSLVHHTWEVIRVNRWLLLTGGLILAVVIVRYVGQGRGMGSPRALRLEYWGDSFWTNFLTVLTVHAHYLKLLIAPVTLIASYQGAFPLAHSLFEWRVIVALVLLFSLMGLIVYGLRKDTLIGFAIAFYMVTLLPVSQIIPHHELLAEHYLYLSMFGFALLCSHLLMKLVTGRPSWKRAIYAAAGIIIIALSARTVVRIRDWKDSFTLWNATYQAVPNSTRAVYNLGVERLKRNEVDQAIQLLQRAIELDPGHILAYNNLAAAYLIEGEHQRALDILQQALTLSPDRRDRIVWAHRDQTYKMILRNIAKSYLELGQPAKAMEYVQQLIDISPDDPAAYALQANIYERTNRFDAALEACRKGLQINTASVELRVIMARLLESQGRAGEALGQWQELLKTSPTHQEANIRLAVHAMDQDQTESAAQHLRNALTQPLSQEQLNTLVQKAAAPYAKARSILLMARIYHLMHETDQAINLCRQGLEPFPADRDLRNQLAFLYADTKNFDGAAAEWKRVLETHPHDYLASLNLGSYYLSKNDVASAQKYLDIALANASDETSRRQVLDIMNQIKDRPEQEK